MLSNSAIVSVPYSFSHCVNTDGAALELNKQTILDAVRALYLAECERSIQPDEKVQKELAAELVAHCLEPR